MQKGILKTKVKALEKQNEYFLGYTRDLTAVLMLMTRFMTNNKETLIEAIKEKDAKAQLEVLYQVIDKIEFESNKVAKEADKNGD